MVEVEQDRRELRDHAREIKFLVDPELGERIRAWQRAHLEPDPMGTGPNKDEYATTSLYFDTDKYDVYYGRGSFGRAKFRVRRYGNEPVIFLERKFRTDRLLAKRRTTVDLADLERLEPMQTDPTWKGYWFHRRLIARGLGPVLQFSYDRTARLGTSETGPVRLIQQAFLAKHSTLLLVAGGVLLYGMLQLTEAVGLWMMKRWGEYVAAVATTVFIPLEIYELIEKVTWLRVGALVVNLFAIGYLVYTKRLFGARGGHAAFVAERHSASLIEVERSASRRQPPVDAHSG